MIGRLRIDEKTAQVKISRLRLLLFDVDGVLTDGGIILGPGGSEYKRFHVQDGLGFNLARRAGLKTGIITARQSEVVERRAQELHVDAFHQGAQNKLPAFEAIIKQFGLADDQVCYMGDDLLDLVILRRAGFSAAPANGRPEVLDLVDYITSAPGGQGAARELIDLVLKGLGVWEKLVSELY